MALTLITRRRTDGNRIDAAFPAPTMELTAWCLPTSSTTYRNDHSPFDAVNIYIKTSKEYFCENNTQRDAVVNHRPQDWDIKQCRCGIMVDPRYIARNLYPSAGSSRCSCLISLRTSCIAAARHSDVDGAGVYLSTMGNDDGLKNSPTKPDLVMVLMTH